MSKNKSELAYMKGSSLDICTAIAKQQRLIELKETLIDYMRYSEQSLENFIGKKDTKNKDRTIKEYAFHRDLLYFLNKI